MYIIMAFYIGVGVVYALRCFRFFTRSQFWAMVTVFPIMIAALGIQLIYPQLRIELFAHAVGILLLLFMVQKPEERTNPVTGFGRDSAYAVDVEQALYNNRKIQILLVNVTNYKSLRDILGYVSMNKLMHTVAENIVSLCKAALPKADPYYLGRGKFCLVVGKENFERVPDAAKAINEMLKQDMDINLQSCICIVRCPEDFHDFQSLYAFSNEFEEYGKSGETGRIIQAEEILNDGRYIIKDIEGIIDNAMNKEGMEVYYQPIYSVERKRFVSAEALLRLNDQEYGHISPELFIPVAEKSGVIHKIGSFVLEEVCRFIASDEFKELDMEYIEVNLSMVQCMQENLYEDLLRIMEEYDVPSRMVDFEITETYSVSNNEVLVSNMDHLISKGSTFAADDFGTGFATTTYLMDYPFKIIKLDKSFIWKAMEEEKAMNILRHTAGMIKSLNLLIVAEGVETLAQVRELIRMKVDFLQGFYFSKPLNQKDYLHFLDHEAIKYKTIEAD